MKYKYRLSFLLIWLPMILSRVPPNPCPDIFHYYKDDEGIIYGVVNLPYDDATSLIFSVNASFVGNPKQTKLRLERLTKVHELNDGTTEVTYNIYFPSNEVIPKITGITYNNIMYCSSYEPLGATRIVNVRYQHDSNFTRQEKGFYKPETEQDISEDNIPVKNPIEKPTTTPRVAKPTPDRVTPVPPQMLPPQHKLNESPTVLDPPNSFLKPSQDILPPVPNPTETDTDLIDEKFIDNLFTTPFTTPSSNSDFKCGKEQQKNEVLPFILGGTNTRIGHSHYPWLVALFSKMVHKCDYKCSATLISDKHVLTGRPVQFSNVLSPVCLWKGNTDLSPLVNKLGIITGLEQDNDTPEIGLTHRLREKRVEMTIISQSECLGTPLGFQDVTSDKTFCSKRRETVTGPCIGDVGAGFYIFMDGAYYLRGIASNVFDKYGTCALINRYAVFSDVAKFLDWIKSHMT